jgi:hypothetical protein
LFECSRKVAKKDSFPLRLRGFACGSSDNFPTNSGAHTRQKETGFPHAGMHEESGFFSIFDFRPT